MKRKLLKLLAAYLVISMLAELVSPLTTYALTTGPSSPEFASFEPVTTTQMVNEFTGDFVYNLPLINVPGPNGSEYAMSLSYHAGARPEEEASWVGYGWTLNPGAINRMKRGIADDHKGVETVYYNKTERNYTEGMTFTTGFSYSSYIGIDASLSARFNNYKGYGWGVGAGIESFGAGVGYYYDVTEETASYSLNINPTAMISAVASVAAASENKNRPEAKNYWENYFSDQIDGYKNEWKSKLLSFTNFSFSSNYGLFSTERVEYPTVTSDYTGASNQYAFNMGVSYAGFTWGLGYNTSYSYQDAVDKSTKTQYGFLYTPDANEDAGEMTDYYRDHETPFKMNDNFLSAAFSNPDMFMVSGEGIGGGFRLYNKNVAHLKAPYTKNETTIKIGGNYISVGGSPWNTVSGSGTSYSETKAWKADGEYNYSKNEDESYFFRYDGDMGGYMSFSKDEAERVGLNQTVGNGSTELIQQTDYLGGTIHKYEPDYSNLSISEKTDLNEYNRVGRSSYIGYHTNEQMKEGFSYFLDDDAKSKFVDRSDAKIKSGIGEIVTYNEAGMSYHYGLPVYAKNEGNISYGITSADEANIHNNYWVSTKDISNCETKVGQYTADPYATSYLLTDIVTPDYIDRTLDGITDDDFGGWTKFNYSRKYGANTKSDNGNWYKWRIPYTGLLYHEGQLSTNKDNMGSAVFGVKEIYYLESIETKTHIAKFILSERNDAIGAATNEDAAKGIKGTQKLYKLDKIELYAKDKDGEAGRLLQVVNFSYDYSLMAHTPNSTALNGGRLTLKKVWIDYEGIYNARISPYEFSYEYMSESEFPDHIKNKYPSITSYKGTKEENPDYEMYNIDAWGNYQNDGDQKYNCYKTWLSQNPKNDFDPAAWQLKSIELPSGGKILVQYDQHEYKYVQDYPAFGMVRLKTPNGSEYKDESTLGNQGLTTGTGKSIFSDFTKRYYLDFSALGVDDSNPLTNKALQEWKDYLSDYFTVSSSQGYKANQDHVSDNFYETDKGTNMIYAKFLYSLEGETPSTSSSRSEFITGFVYVDKVDIDANGLYIKLGNTDYDAPMREICRDYVKTNRNGTVSGNKWATNDLQDLPDRGVNVNDLAAVDQAIVGDFLFCDKALTASEALSIVTADVPQFFVKRINHCNNAVDDLSLSLSNGIEYNMESICKTINVNYSYLRIPLKDKKLGGGPRVKRLLMYDEGIASNSAQAVLYGTEYVYELTDGTTSGVATNEPSAVTEECGLVQLLNVADDQSFSQNSWLYGLDKRQISGPIAQSMYPSASIGYSRVVSKNIHTAENTNTGFQIKEYNTAYDYPVEVKTTGSPLTKNFEPVLAFNYHNFLQQSVMYQTIDDLYNKLIDLEDIMQNSNNLFASSSFENALENLVTLLQDILNSGILSGADAFIQDLIDFLTDIIAIVEKGYVSFPDIANALSSLLDVFTPGDIDEFLTGNFTSLLNPVKDPLAKIFEAASAGTTEEYYNKVWAAQGYSIVFNEMHGQPKAMENFEGSYNYIHTPSLATLVSAQYYTYEEPGKGVMVLDKNYDVSSYDPEDIDNYNFDKDPIGKMQEILMEGRRNTSNMEQTTLSNDVAKSFVFSLLGWYELGVKKNTCKSIQELYTHVTTKVNRYPALLKSVESYKDGVETKINNVVYDKLTGKVAITRSFDEFHKQQTPNVSSHNGVFTTLSIPASSQYEQMGQKADNEGFYKDCYSSTVDRNDYGLEMDLKLSGSTYYLEIISYENFDEVQQMLDHIFAGDLIVVKTQSSVNNVYYFYVQENYLHQSGSVMKIYLTKADRNGKSLFFITQSNVALEVLRSSRTNQLNAIAGSLLTYGDCDDYAKIKPNLTNQLNTINTVIQSVESNKGMNNIAQQVQISNTYLTKLNPENIAIQNYVNTQSLEKMGFNYPPVLEMMQAYIASAAALQATITNQAVFLSTFYDTYDKVNSISTLISKQDFFQIMEDYKVENPTSFMNAGLGNNALTTQKGIIEETSEKLNTLMSSLKSGSTAGFILTSNGVQDKIDKKTKIIMENATSVSLTKSKTGGTYTLAVSNDKVSQQYLLSPNGAFDVSIAGEIFFEDKKLNEVIAIPEIGGIGSFIIVDTTYTPLCNVLKASSTIYTSHWYMEEEIKKSYEITTDNEWQSGEYGKWRPKYTYVYNSSIRGGASYATGERIYKNAGVSTEFYLFNWNQIVQHDNWKRTITNTAYSPDGQPIEEKNALDVFNTAKYGYEHSVPYLVATNAEYNSVLFEGFENNYSTDSTTLILEGGVSTAEGMLDRATCHSGYQSIKLVTELTDSTIKAKTVGALTLKPFDLTTQFLDEGMLVKVWIKVDKFSDNDSTMVLLEEASGFFPTKKMQAVARVWDWVLYEGEIIASDWGSLVMGDSFIPVIKVVNAKKGASIWLDDVRLQPSDAEMQCNVYDPMNLRLLASFDSQHFGMYYQYNAEGALIRKVAETEKAKYTLQEMYSNDGASKKRASISIKLGNGFNGLIDSSTPDINKKFN